MKIFPMNDDSHKNLQNKDDPEKRDTKMKTYPKVMMTPHNAIKDMPMLGSHIVPVLHLLLSIYLYLACSFSVCQQNCQAKQEYL